MSKIINVAIRDIEPNPFRELGEYPYVERKLETLQRSIEDVGLWEGVIARKHNDKYQLAFGHHRIEAARRNKLKDVNLVVRVLTDEQMLQLMGRENMEDYNADFLCMLETWDAGVKYRFAKRELDKPIEIARLLGWTRFNQDKTEQLNNTASACNAAHNLISGGYLGRSDLKGISVSAAQQIVERAQARMEQLENMAKQTKRPYQEVERAKKQVAKGAQATARDVRRGEVSQKEIRGRVDFHSYKYAAADKKQTPLFGVFGNALRKQLQAILLTDNAAEKLEEIHKAINVLQMEEDLAVVRGIKFDLSEIPARVQAWEKKLVPTDQKVIKLLREVS